MWRFAGFGGATSLSARRRSRSYGAWRQPPSRGAKVAASLTPPARPKPAALMEEIASCSRRTRSSRPKSRTFPNEFALSRSASFSRSTPQKPATRRMWCVPPPTLLRTPPPSSCNISRSTTAAPLRAHKGAIFRAILSLRGQTSSGPPEGRLDHVGALLAAKAASRRIELAGRGRRHRRQRAEPTCARVCPVAPLGGTVTLAVS